MGYHPFWTLLPSMVNLTLRSIRLRETLESMGVKVIEVYPGAAQDRLGLPRKQRGEDALLAWAQWDSASGSKTLSASASTTSSTQ